jgi:glycosyltransferase involved in cell wall biosynthesis
VSAALRVLIALPDAMPSVAHRATVALLPHLARHHVDPVVCFLGEGPLLALCRDELHLETLVVPSGGSGAARRAIESALRSTRAVLAHSVGAGTHLLVGPAARRAGLPTVWSQFDGASVGSVRQVRAALAPSRAILVASSLVEARQRRLNLRRTPLTLLPPSARRAGDSREARRQRARNALRLGADAFAFGWLSGAAPGVEIGVALRAASSVCHARARARLVVFADPATSARVSLETALRPLATSLGIETRCSIAPGHTGPGLPPAFDALDAAFIVSGDTALVALAPIEALAAGLPLVAADVPATRESVTHGQDGLLVPSGDHEAFAAALLSLCDDPEERQRLRTAAEKTVRERFDVHDAARNVAQVYRKALER